MPPMTSEAREKLLRTLAYSDAGDARGQEFTPELLGRWFYPVAEHLRALEPDVTLVVGDRGAGKTELVAIARRGDLVSALERYAPELRRVQQIKAWLQGYPDNPDNRGPDPMHWQRFAQAFSADRTAFQEIWFTYLVRQLRDFLPDVRRDALSSLLECDGVDAEACLNQFRQAGTAPTAALDELDTLLERRGEYIVVMYDELDALYYSDWEAMGAIVRGLIGFWSHYSRRWPCIRGKIFLRTDLYSHHREVLGADVAKLAANRVELAWSDKSLYGVLLKRLANPHLRADDHGEWLTYCRASGVEYRDDGPLLGWTPVLRTMEDARPLIERMIGMFMGANPKKGTTFTWIISRIQDANRRAVPRSIVQLVQQAARIEMDIGRASGTHVLSPASLRLALDQVSTNRVDQVMSQGGFPWLRGLKERLEGQQVPWDSRRELERLLARGWEEPWSRGDQLVRPPAENPRELVDVLLELGIVRDRGLGTYDVPDLYRKGLGLRRKGGVSMR